METEQVLGGEAPGREEQLDIAQEIPHLAS